jgi:hypothetical protein
MEGVGIAYVFCALLYMMACIMDGPDVKPLWKKLLGLKLAKVADYYYPIDYCNRDKCFYPKRYRTALKSVRELKEELKQLKVYRRPNISVTTSDNVRLESNIEIPEWEVMNSECESKRLMAQGFPAHLLPSHLNLNFIIENAKRNCVKGIEKTIEENNLVNIEVDKESRYPAIHVRGWLYVGRKRA